MSKKKSQNLENVVRCYEVTDPTLHPKGYTVYKVTERIIFIDALEQSIKEAVIWKRFNDFQKLHKNMSSLHSALHRREEFPEFPKPQLFHRFEKAVIVERMQSAQDLLNFVGQRHYLVGCKAFKEFFSGAQPVATSPKCDDLLLPGKSVCDITQSLSEPKDVRSLTEFSSGDEQDPKLCRPDPEHETRSSRESLVDDPSRADFGEGFWCYRQTQDETSLGGLEDAEDGENESDDDNFMPDILDGTPSLTGNCLLTGSDLVMFDPLAKGLEADQGNGLSNECLLQSVTVDDVNQRGGLLLEADENFPNVDASSEVSSNSGNKTLERSLSSKYASDIADILGDATVERPENPSSQLTSSGSSSHRTRKKSAVESGKGDLTVSPLHQLDDQKSSPSFHGCLPQLLSSGHTVSPKKLPWSASLPYAGSQDKPCYIVEAAEQISTAQKLEATGAYHEAFSQYKYGVATLLKGVQKDCDERQREAVRKKISLYLKKAEALYHEHLTSCGDQNNISRWDLEFGGNLTEVDSSIALLRGAAAELSRYKVVGLLSKVLLVVDTGTDGSFVIKVLHKSSVPLRSQKTIVPTHIPYMVSLVKFFETDSAIYLVLQHAAGGTLWNYVGGYFGQFVQTTDICGDPHEQQLRSGGRKTRSVKIHPASSPIGDADSDGQEPFCVSAKTKSDTNDPVNDAKNNVEPDQLSLTESVTNKPNNFNDSLNKDLENGCASLRSSSENDEEINDIECDQDFKSILESCVTDINSYSICSEDSNIASLSRLASVSSDQSEATTVAATAEINTRVNVAASEGHFEVEDAARLRSNEFDADARDCVASSAAPSDAKSLGVETGGKCSTPEIVKTKGDLDLPLGKSSLRTRSGMDFAQQTNRSDFREPLKSPSMSQLSSQKSDADSASNGHRRFRTLSSVFAELDLAADVPSENRHVMQLPEGCICQWAAELVVALSRLHALGIICRDLHPGNILLGDSGHILLTYFSQWMTIDHHISSEAMNGLYCAPEVSGVSDITAACDWWSLGAILYELFACQSLRACHPAGITSHTTISLPSHVSEEACALITELLKFNPAERLGSGIGESDDVRSHPFFARIQWNHLLG